MLAELLLSLLCVGGIIGIILGILFLLFLCAALLLLFICRDRLKPKKKEKVSRDHPQTPPWSEEQHVQPGPGEAVSQVVTHQELFQGSAKDKDNQSSNLEAGLAVGGKFFPPSSF